MNRENLQKVVDALIGFTYGSPITFYDRDKNCFIIVDTDENGIISDIKYERCPAKQFDLNLLEEIGSNHYCYSENYSEEHPFKKFISSNTYHERLHSRHHINRQRRYFRY